MKFIAKYKVEGTEESTLSQCLEYCKSKSYLGIDIETSVNPEFEHLQTKVHKGGLDPYLSNIVLLQIGDLDEQFVIDVRDYTKEELKPLIDFIHLNNNVTFIGQNLRFEVKHLLHKYGILFSKIYDTMICEMVLFNGIKTKFDLASLAVKYLGKKKADSFDLFNLDEKSVSLDEESLINDYILSPFDIAENKIIDKSTRLEFINIADRPVNFKQIEYAGDDIIDPILIAIKQKQGRQLKSGEIYKPLKAFRLENKFVTVVGEMELSGMKVNKKVWEDLYEKYIIEVKRVEKRLIEYVNSNHPKFAGQYDLFTGEVDCKIEWSSSKQVIAFFRYLGICPKEYSKSTKKLDWTVGAVALLKTISLKNVENYGKLKEPEEVKTNEDFTLLYLIYKKYSILTTTFGKDWLRYVHPITGCVHPSFVQLVNTGRMACRNPNLQQLSGSSGHRDAFTLLEDNKWLLNADFSNMELRTIADKANEKNMLKFFNDGDEFFGADLHSYTATLIDRTKYKDNTLIVQPKELATGGKNPNFTGEDSEKRGKSKQISFGLAFGKGVSGFASDFRTTIEETEVFVQDYYNAYPGLEPWFASQHKKFDKRGYIVINEDTDFRWFCEEFEDITNDYNEVKSHFSDGYYKKTTADRKLEREDLFKKNKNLHSKWKRYWRVLSAWHRKSQNAPVQGTSANMTKVAALYFREKMIEKGIYIKYVNFSNIVHDEIIPIFIENDLYTKEEIGKDLETSMAKGGKMFNKRVVHVGKAEIIKEWAH